MRRDQSQIDEPADPERLLAFATALDAGRFVAEAIDVDDEEDREQQARDECRLLPRC